MDGVVLTVQLDQLGAKVGTDAGEHLAKGAQVLAGQHPADTWSPRPTVRRHLVASTK
jgi:hypothetical protein